MATTPIGVAVDLYTVRLLPGICIYKALMPKQMSTIRFKASIDVSAGALMSLQISFAENCKSIRSADK